MSKTFRQEMESMLYENGMFEDQAKAVMDKAEKSPALESMKGRWNDGIDQYPPTMSNVVALHVKNVAAEWIKENQPMAWFRPLFDDNYAKQIGLSLEPQTEKGQAKEQPLVSDTADHTRKPSPRTKADQQPSHEMQ